MSNDDVWRITIALIVAATLASMMVNLPYKSPNHLSVSSVVIDTAQTLGCRASNACSVNQMINGQAYSKA